MHFARIAFLIPTLTLATLVAAAPSDLPISGEVIDGQRQIALPAEGPAPDLHIYRGDYVNFLPEGDRTMRLQIADLSIDESLPKRGEKSYVKFKEAGEYDYLLDGRAGWITVHELAHSNYREMRAREARELIETVHPLILDVRTAREFSQGHVEGAKLLPIRELQHRVEEISAHRDEPIFIYCRSGNRSTVAARILMDRGFERIYNLRYGIVEWTREGLPLVH